MLIPFNQIEENFYDTTQSIDENEGQQTVLLIEDDPALLDFLFKIFTVEGY